MFLLVLAYPGCHAQKPLNGFVCVCVCVYIKLHYFRVTLIICFLSLVTFVVLVCYCFHCAVGLR